MGGAPALVGGAISSRRAVAMQSEVTVPVPVLIMVLPVIAEQVSDAPEAVGAA